MEVSDTDAWAMLETNASALMAERPLVVALAGC